MNTAHLALAVSLALATACTPNTPTESASIPPPPVDTAPPAQHAPAVHTPTESTAAAPKLQSDLRALWRGHIDHTRAYAMAVKGDKSTGAEAAAKGVVANAKEISAAVGSFYGDAAGGEMLRLLSGHWAGIKAMTDAAAKGNEAGVQAGMDDAIINAGEIAKFLAGANPNLPETTVDGMMVTHVQHHRAQITEIMAGDTAAEAKTWTAMQAHMDALADALAGAIAKQFPDKAS